MPHDSLSSWFIWNFSWNQFDVVFSAFIHNWWRNEHQKKTVKRSLVSYHSEKKQKKTFFIALMCFFAKRGWKWKKNCYPFLYSVIFFPSIMNAFEKKAHFPSQHRIFFLSKKRKKKFKRRRKKLRIVVAIPCFFLQCFSRKTENITMSGKKFSACAIQSQKNLSVFFFFSKKK